LFRLAQYKAGALDVRPTLEVAIGNYVDRTGRNQLVRFFDSLRMPTGPWSAIRINRKAYDTWEWPFSYRLPDLRVGNFAFDISLRAKSYSDSQIRRFFNADFAPTGVVIVRPNQLGGNSSYIIWRREGE
jgi:hypothetical protein